MKSVVTFFAVLLLAGAVSQAQDRPTVTAQANTIFVGADGKFEANPDTALIQFDISAQEENSRAAYDRASKQAEQVRQILRSNGIEPAAAQLGYFSIEPIYDYKQAKRKLVAYRVDVKVSLKLKDFSKIAPIVQQLSDADITDQQSYVDGVAVGAPPAELGRVAETPTLHMVVADLDHTLRAQRHERKVLAGIPA